MNMDIATLAEFVVKWLIPANPRLPVHEPYRMAAGNVVELFYGELAGRPEQIDLFLEGLDALLYVEHPIYREGYFGGYDLVAECLERGMRVFGIPMWEWWPEDETWALRTHGLWCVTRYTRDYLSALATVLTSRGQAPAWANALYGSRWGINPRAFRYRQRNRVRKIVYVHGNGGYKQRKAADLVLPFLVDLARSGMDITVHSQKGVDFSLLSDDWTELIDYRETVFPDRAAVYEHGDVFLFPSYWEGLCHGLYEACFSGALAITTDAPPMNECAPAFLIPVEAITSETLAKPVRKAIPSMAALTSIINGLYNHDCEHLSYSSHCWVAENCNLTTTIALFYEALVYRASIYFSCKD
jgi:hypothetical protein